MRALTVRQPWASLIALGVKTIETRSWSTSYRGPIAIHAGAAKPHEWDEFGDWRIHEMANGTWRAFHLVEGEEVGLHDSIHLPLGAVVATAVLTEVVPMFDRWSRMTETAEWPYAEDHGWIELNLSNPHLEWAKPAEMHRPPEVGQRNGWIGTDVSGQVPFGEFAPGRWAWLLDDVQPLDEPVPAKGRLGLWEWAA